MSFCHKSELRRFMIVVVGGGGSLVWLLLGLDVGFCLDSVFVELRSWGRWGKCS